jgi:hypothetical protein
MGKESRIGRKTWFKEKVWPRPFEDLNVVIGQARDSGTLDGSDGFSKSAAIGRLPTSARRAEEYQAKGFILRGGVAHGDN